MFCFLCLEFGVWSLGLEFEFWDFNFWVLGMGFVVRNFGLGIW